MRILKKSLFVLFLLAVMAGAFTFTNKFLVAQDQSPQELAMQDAMNAKGTFKVLKEEDILAMAFPDDKSGCSNRLGIFLATGQKYKDGDNVADMVSYSMMKPIFEGYYNDIRQKGYAKAAIENMAEYRKCVSDAKPHDDRKKESELQAKHFACTRFSSALVDVLSSVEQRRKVESVADKYKNANINFKDTAYANLPDPMIMFIGQIYKTAQNKSYDDAVSLAHSLLVGCTM